MRAHTQTLTNCSEHIAKRVHLPSHFPILEGSGRGLGPRRLREKDGSPVRSRLPGGLSSHHSRRIHLLPASSSLGALNWWHFQSDGLTHLDRRLAWSVNRSCGRPRVSQDTGKRRREAGGPLTTRSAVRPPSITESP